MTHNNNNDDRKKFYLYSPSRINKRVRHLVRQRVIVNYRPIVEANRTVPTYKQFFEIMNACRDNEEFLTKAEVTILLREDNLSTQLPTLGEFTALNRILHQFRKWVGPLQIMVAYGDKIPIDGHDTQKVFRPFSKLGQYKELSKHIQLVIKGLKERDSDNRTVLSLTRKQMQQRIDEMHNEIQREVLVGHRRKRR